MHNETNIGTFSDKGEWKPVSSGGNALRSAVYSFRGRVARLRFTISVLAITLLLGAAVGAVASASKNPQIAIGIALLFGLPTAWTMLALVVKRLHDMNLSAWHLGWVILVLAAPSFAIASPAQIFLIAGTIILQLWLVFKRGSRGANRFGDDPRGTRSGASSAIEPKAPQARGSGLRWLVTGLVGLAVIGAAAVGLAELSDTGAPTCSDPEVTSRVATLAQSYVEGDVVALFAGGMYNLKLSARNVRTLSNNEPLHGRTCVATVDVIAKAGPQAGKGILGSREMTYTVQLTDTHEGRYVVKLTQ